jgi:hypothetical protein
MNQKIALFLLKIFAMIYEKYFKGSVSLKTNQEVNTRYQALLNAALAGNVPDISWADVLNFLKLDDGSVVKASLRLQQVWTDKEWADTLAAVRDRVAQKTAAVGNFPTKTAPDAETLEAWRASHDATPLQNELTQDQAALAEMEAV